MRQFSGFSNVLSVRRVHVGLLDLRAEESRVVRHVKPPRCGEESRWPHALSRVRTQAIGALAPGSYPLSYPSALWCQWMTLIKLNWCNNPAFQLIFPVSSWSCSLYGTFILFKGYRSITMSQVSLECAKYLQLGDSGCHKSEILTHIMPSVPEYFWRRYHRSLVFFLTRYWSNSDLSICFRCNR